MSSDPSSDAPKEGLRRIFIGLDLAALVRAELAAEIERLKRIPFAGLRWVPVQNLHLTLKFLGPTEDDQLQGILPIVQKVAQNTREFEYRVAGLGAFPSWARARVLWVGMEGPPIPQEIAAELNRALSQIGFNPELKAFVPHLTIARLKTSSNLRGANLARVILEQERHFSSSSALCQAITVFESKLPKNSGAAPVYERIAELRLGG